MKHVFTLSGTLKGRECCGDEDKNKLVVVTLLFLSNDGDDLVYDYKVVGGKMPESGGLTGFNP